MNIVFGADIGGTDIKLGMFWEDGSLLEKWLIPTRVENNGQTIFDDVVGEIERKMAEKALPRENVLGIGCGFPAPVDNRFFVKNCVNLGIRDIYPGEEISKRLPGMIVRIGNDANLAALGEMWQGSGRGNRNLLLVTLGTGVGSGIVIDGKIVNGRHGIAGEIGHFMVDSTETERCSCGGTGHLNQIASVPGILYYARKFLKEDTRPSLLREKEYFGGEDLTNAARAGDAVALRTLDYCMAYLAKGLAISAHIIDPDIFLVGGGMARAGRLITDMIRKHYLSNHFLTKEETDIRLASLGNDAGIYGAAKMIIDANND